MNPETEQAQVRETLQAMYQLQAEEAGRRRAIDQSSALTQLGCLVFLAVVVGLPVCAWLYLYVVSLMPR